MKDKFILVTTGRLVSWKNISGTIQAVTTLIIQDRINLELWIIGDGPEKESLQKQARNLPVIFWGKLSHGETLAKLRQADIFVLNSLYEGLPHTILEAFSLKVPVIATDIPGTNEVAIDGKTALLVKPGDYHDLATEIKKLLRNPRRSAKLVKSAAGLLQTKFTWPKHLAKLTAEFRKL